MANETDILRGLLDAAASTEGERQVIEIARKGKVFFRFGIRPLAEAEYNACRDKATKYKKNRRLGGIKMPDDTDTARYRSYLIYEATVPEDQQKYGTTRRLGISSMSSAAYSLLTRFCSWRKGCDHRADRSSVGL